MHKKMARKFTVLFSTAKIPAGGVKDSRKPSPILISSFTIFVLLFLAFLIAWRSKNTELYTVSLSDCTSDILQFDGSSWMTAGEGNEFTDPITLLSSSTFDLDAGSYTIVVDYDSDKELNCLLSSSSSGVFLHANSFRMSRNKNRVSYDFYTTRHISDAALQINNYYSGACSLSQIQIYRNTHNLRLLFFSVLLFSAGLQFFLYSNFFAKYKKCILLLFSISLIATLPYFSPGVHWGHDLPFHLLRIEGIAEGLKVGQFPVRMNTVFHDGYGYPVSVFYGDLFLYIPAILRIIGFSIATTFKLFVWLINLGTTCSAYYLGKKVFTDEKLALVTSAVYTLSSYRLLDLYVRNAVGEYTALLFLPLIAVAVWEIYTKEGDNSGNKKNIFLLAGGMLGLLYSHLLTLEMTTFVLLVFALTQWKKTFRKERFLVLLQAIGWFLFAGLAFLAPFLDYYLHTPLDLARESATYIQSLGAYLNVYFSVFMGIYSNSPLQTSPGLVLMTGLFVAIFFLLTGRGNKQVKGWTIFSCLLLLLASNLFPWNQLTAASAIGETLAAIQFPWRYVGLSLIPLTLLLGTILRLGIEKGYWSSKLLYVTGFAATFGACIFISFFTAGASRNQYLDTAELTKYFGEAGLNGSQFLLNDTDISALDSGTAVENGTASILEEHGTDLILNADIDENGTIEIPRFHYANYIAVNEDGIQYSLETGTNNKIKILMPESYQGFIYVSYQVPIFWRAAEIISLCTLLTAVVQIKNYNKKIHRKGKKA